jgi:type IV secretion system protein VirB10
MSFWDRLRAKRVGSATQDSVSVQPDAGRANSDAQRENEQDTVPGERGVASIHRARSLQSRVSNVLAAGLMAALALGFLAWYYTQVFSRESRAEAAQTSKSRQKAQAEMPLPPLGRVDPPVMEKVLGPPPDLPPAVSMLGQIPQNEPRPYAAAVNYGQAPSGAPERRATDRRLSGPVFVSASSVGAETHDRTMAENPQLSDSGEFPPMPSPGPASGPNALAGLLEPTATPAVRAKVLPTQRLLLPKGAFVDCTLETAIDSSLPGMTTCITATDTFGADGSVVLLERGTKLVGETRGDVRQGSARVYVLWTEARTPDGVVVPLASPGTDELGRAGLPGDVNRHFWERFGAAILVSVIDGAVQAAVQRSSDGAGTVIVNPSTSRDVMTEVLRSTINIPPTVTKQHGDRIAVLVARDLDFRSVYELRPAALGR